MARKPYDEARCVRSLSKKGSIHFTQVGTLSYIEILKNATDVGNGSWGKIDYLRKIHGYIPVFVNLFTTGPKRNSIISNYNEYEDNTKIVKRERKFNMATMAKTAMKRVKTK